MESRTRREGLGEDNLKLRTRLGGLGKEDLESRTWRAGLGEMYLERRTMIGLGEEDLESRTSHCSYLDISISPKSSEKSDDFPNLTLAQYILKK